MTTRWKMLLCFALAVAAAALGLGRAAEAQDGKEVKPIKALLITGGCCHDYGSQKKILPEAISKIANVEWTIVHQGGSSTKSMIPFYEKEDWYKGYDVVVHNECFADAADPAWTARILKAHREGVPAVVIHCAMHCYRDKTDQWFEFLGVTSRRHGANYPFDVVNLTPDDPVMKDFGEKWSTPKGELYIIEKLWPTATPLAHAMSRDTKKNEVVIWKNLYGDKTRVFGTTIGHHNEEMNDPVFQNYIARGLLWACDKLNDDYLQPAKEPKFEEVPDPTADKIEKKEGSPTPATPKGNKQTKKVKLPVNLAKGKTATASTHQQDSQVNHLPGNAVDENLSTRWCARNAEANQWWQVDLGKPEDITGCRIVWEFDNAKYDYKIEGSADGKEWKTLVDKSNNDIRSQEQEHKFAADGVRYVKISVTGLDDGRWCSFFEFEVHGKELVEREVPVGAMKSVATGGKSLLAGIKAPEGFSVSLFAAPPAVGYPTCLAAAPSGELFVGIDENGSLGAAANRGRVLRCIDTDGDGEADEFKTFATMDSPRGVVWDEGTLYVLHPPHLTAYHDDNGDGQADREERIVDGIGFDLKFRGADHTTNGMRLAIDGYLYIAVGDYGFLNAKGKDGTELQLYGGGVARVRTDGSGLEIVSRGQRNIYDVAVDPLLNAFTRDNTNDGGGWDVRLSHVIPGGQYGYPSLYINFPEEIVQPLADYGGGSPCGSLYLQEAAVPGPFGDALYTCDWGRSVVYRHPLQADGAGFEAEQTPFVELPRPTDMDVDGSGRIYISSWKDGGFNFSGPNVGYVIRVTADDAKPAKFPDLKKASDDELVKHLAANSHVLRLAVQREMLRRGDKPAFAAGLEKLASGDAELPVRVAAIFTLKQLRGEKATDALVKLCDDAKVREFALKALADDLRLAGKVPAKPFVEALGDRDARVRMTAASGLARLKAASDAAAIVPLLGDADPLVRHTAINSLVALEAAQPCLEALTTSSSDDVISGAAQVLRRLHRPDVVEGLIGLLDSNREGAARDAAFVALCRLHFQAAEWDGKWWGTRPDTTGPYFKHVEWEQTPTIRAAIEAALKQADGKRVGWQLQQMQRHKIDLTPYAEQVLELARGGNELPAAVELLGGMTSVPAPAVALLVEVASDGKADRGLRAKALRTLAKAAGNGAEVSDKLIAAFDASAGIDDPQHELVQARLEFARLDRHAGNVDDFIKLASDGSAARRELAYLVLTSIEASGKAKREARNAARETIQAAWGRPEAATPLLRAVGLSRAEQYVLQVTAQLNSEDSAVKQAATYAADKLAIDLTPIGDGKDRVTVASMSYEDVLAAVQSEKGDVKLGMRLFARQNCVACHTVTPGEQPKGPFLGGIAARYKRHELAESILKPSAKLAQGFESQVFLLADGRVLQGFVSREAGDETEVRDEKGTVHLLRPDDIEERKKSEVSIMPNGLADKLTVKELAAILAFLESLPAK
jgi:putative membrane-bound dehydrogenase-like protein